MKVFTLIILLFNSYNFLCQKTEKHIDFSNVKVDFDSTDHFILSEYEISTDSDAFLKKYRRTKYFVSRVYDYSKIASNMLMAFQDTLEYMDSKRMNKRYLNRANKILKQEEEDKGEYKYIEVINSKESKLVDFTLIQKFLTDSTFITNQITYNIEFLLSYFCYI